eukprot:1357476-Amorphochlora_amoeboformis.AAC.3
MSFVLKAQGECNKNPAYMLVHCAKSCGSCFLSDKKYRCVRNETNNPPAISKPGELNSMFESIMEDFAEFQPVVHRYALHRRRADIFILNVHSI